MNFRRLGQSLPSPSIASLMEAQRQNGPVEPGEGRREGGETPRCHSTEAESFGERVSGDADDQSHFGT